MVRCRRVHGAVENRNPRPRKRDGANALAFSTYCSIKEEIMKSRWHIRHIVSSYVSARGAGTQTVTTQYCAGGSETSTHPDKGVMIVRVNCSHCGKECEIKVPSVGDMILRTSIALVVFLLCFLPTLIVGGIFVIGTIISGWYLLRVLIESVGRKGLVLIRGDGHSVEYDGKG